MAMEIYPGPNVFPFDTSFKQAAPGINDDTAAINAALSRIGSSSGGGVLQLSPRNYMLAGGTKHILIASNNVILRGAGKGLTTLTLLNVADEDIVKIFSGGSLSNCGVSDLTIDAGSFVTAGHGAVNLNTVTDGFVRNISVINQGQSGITAQGCTRFDISDNDTTLNVALNTQNHGILVAASTQNTYGVIARNRCTNSAMIFSGSQLLITGNYATNWKYGSGVTMGPDTFTHDNVISDNFMAGGTGIDVDGTYCAGYELWSPHSTVTGNIAQGNSGNGIMIGGEAMTCTGNLSYQNGVGNNTGDDNGIYLQTNGVQAGTDCIVAGNRCYGQNYGFGRNVAVTTVRIGVNNFAGNNIAETNIVWTPAVTSSGGAFTSVTITGKNFVIIGDIVTFSLTIHVTTLGPASGTLQFILPSLPASNSDFRFGGFNSSTSVILTGLVAQGSTTANVVTSAGAFPVTGNDQFLQVTGFYQSTSF
jgi:hypothetical protein